MAKILITDDSLFMRTSLRTMLESAGYETCEASNGIEMLRVYEEEQPDVVTLDITMPEMDGREALRQLRAKYPQARVIMCTAMGQKTMVMDAIRDGALNFLVKPFEKSNVLDSISKALNV